MALARAGPAPDAPCRPPQRTLSQMDPTLFWYVVAAVLVLVGLAGVILPALPGLPLVFIGMLVAAWAGDFERTGQTGQTAADQQRQPNQTVGFKTSVVGCLGCKPRDGHLKADEGAFDEQPHQRHGQ